MYLRCEFYSGYMYLGFSSMWPLGVVVHLMFVNILKCLKSIHEQILAKVLLRAQSLVVLTLETDYKSEKGYPLDNRVLQIICLNLKMERF